jgi:hypothetical protein
MEFDTGANVAKNSRGNPDSKFQFLEMGYNEAVLVRFKPLS